MLAVHPAIAGKIADRKAQDPGNPKHKVLPDNLTDPKAPIMSKFFQMNGIRLDEIVKEINDEGANVIIFCNPNAGYYELSLFQSDWLSFYLDTMGCGAVLFFNYQGYVRSQGRSSVYSVRSDGQLLYNYLRCVLGVKRIAAHGRSIGSGAACGVALSAMEA